MRVRTESFGMVVAVAIAVVTLLVFASFAPARCPGETHAAHVAEIYAWSR